MPAHARTFSYIKLIGLCHTWACIQLQDVLLSSAFPSLNSGSQSIVCVGTEPPCKRRHSFSGDDTCWWLSVSAIHPSKLWASACLSYVLWNACLHRLHLGLYSQDLRDHRRTTTLQKGNSLSPFPLGSWDQGNRASLAHSLNLLLLQFSSCISWVHWFWWDFCICDRFLIQPQR